MDPNAAPINPSNNLTHIAQEMYKKNFELAQTNNTLSLLRKIDEIILSSITDTNQVAQQIVNTIVSSEDFSYSLIYLLNKKNNSLDKIAATIPNDAKTTNTSDVYPTSISLDHLSNLIVKSVTLKKIALTDSLSQLLGSPSTSSLDPGYQKDMHFKSIIIYPLIIRNSTFGALVLHLTSIE